MCKVGSPAASLPGPPYLVPRGVFTLVDALTFAFSSWKLCCKAGPRWQKEKDFHVSYVAKVFLIKMRFSFTSVVSLGPKRKLETPQHRQVSCDK